MSSLLKGRVECFETNAPIKEGVQDLEDFLADVRSLVINCLILLNRSSVHYIGPLPGTPPRYLLT
jgi:hypothetical protein